MKREAPLLALSGPGGRAALEVVRNVDVAAAGRGAHLDAGGLGGRGQQVLRKETFVVVQLCGVPPEQRNKPAPGLARVGAAGGRRGRFATAGGSTRRPAVGGARQGGLVLAALRLLGARAVGAAGSHGGCGAAGDKVLITN